MIDRVEFDERAETISAAVENYKSGDFGETRARATLALCGLNATEIEELLGPFRASAFENFKSIKRKPTY